MRQRHDHDDLQRGSRGRATQPTRTAPEVARESSLLDIQRDAGNKATAEFVQRAAGSASLQGFGTRSLTTGSAGTLHHEVQWQSSSGSLADLGHIQTRERVSWEPAPAEFGAAAEYGSAGSHSGLGTNTASGGSAVDDHSIIPTGFRYNLPAEGESAVWKMTQRYEMRVGDGDWAPIPDANYEITRWFERRGTELIAYVAKRGIEEGVMHRAMVNVPGFFGA